MRKRIAVALAPVLALVAPIVASLPAEAGSAFENEAAVLRLVAAEPSADGSLRAALAVDLKPGWKTYWLDPGEAGIPPRFDFSGSRDLEAFATHFPVPHRFDDGFSTSTVYSEPFAVAVSARETQPGRPGQLHVTVTLGVCRDVCIPVSAELTADAGDRASGDTVRAAFAALARQSTKTLGIISASLAADAASLTVEVAGPLSERADLFVVNRDGWSFGRPSAARRTKVGTALTVPVTATPRHAADRAPTIDAIVVDGTTAYRVEDLSAEGNG